jgi:hypothetical protein
VEALEPPWKEFQFLFALKPAYSCFIRSATDLIPRISSTPQTRGPVERQSILGHLPFSSLTSPLVDRHTPQNRVPQTKFAPIRIATTLPTASIGNNRNALAASVRPSTKAEAMDGTYGNVFKPKPGGMSPMSPMCVSFTPAVPPFRVARDVPGPANVS